MSSAAWNPGLRVPTQKFWRWFCSGGQKIVRSGNGPSKFKVKKVPEDQSQTVPLRAERRIKRTHHRERWCPYCTAEPHTRAPEVKP